MVPRCDLCDDEDATVHCDGCRYNFCALCSTAVHEDERRRDHVPAPIFVCSPGAAADKEGEAQESQPAAAAAGALFDDTGGGRELVALPTAASHTPVSPILAHRADAAAASRGAVPEASAQPSPIRAPAAQYPDPRPPRCPTAGHVRVTPIGACAWRASNDVRGVLLTRAVRGR
jgi:hypothetical protein